MINQPATQKSSHYKPMSTGERNLAPDLGRGFMLLLIVIAHAPIYLYTAEPVVISRPLGMNLIDDIVNFVGLLFVDNRAYPMFAALYGYGLASMVRRQLAKGVPAEQVKRLLRRRSWLLIVFGFLHFVVIGGADILGLYGFSGLLLGWLLFRSGKAKIRTLVGVSLFYFVVIPLSWFLVTTTMGAGMAIGLTASHTYFGLVLEHTIAYPFVILTQLFIYPMLLAILIGVWVASKQWLDQPDHFRLILKKIAASGILLSIAGAIPLALVGVQLWEPSLEILSLAVVVHIFTGLAGGFGYTALISLFSISARQTAPRTSWLLAAVGKRSLTFYIYQELLLVIILSPVAFGYGGATNSTGVFMIAILIWLSGVGIAALLEQKKLPGPADALLRKLIYRQR